jgi:hypothetical protein
MNDFQQETPVSFKNYTPLGSVAALSSIAKNWLSGEFWPAWIPE